MKRIEPRPQLELRDLELVLALHAANTTAAAAKALHLTQSAVSRALAQAEARVGVRLFERSARGLTATPAGRRLLAGAPSLLEQLRELERVVAAPEAEPRRVRLVCECYTAYRWLPSATLSMRERWSDLQVEVGAEHTASPLAALERGKVDIALLTTSELRSGAAADGLREQPLFSDEVVFVLSSRHPLARHARLSPEALATAVLITGNAPEAEARWFVRAVFGRRRPKLGFLRFPLTEAIIDAARAGMGVAVLSEWMASGYVDRADSGLVVRRLARGKLQRPWRIAYRSELVSVAERLKEALRAAAPRLHAVG
ncbi:MAG: LysR family transcriptional regulator [Myxococcales bacterium]|nr:MAG: LysR family transcriptional regulator [Myxococcales bacterium]